MDHVLGIDVGWSASRASSAVCRLSREGQRWSWRIGRYRADERDRRETIARVIGSAKLSCAAIDGPLTPGFEVINRYRLAERMLTRRIGRLIGKPGSSNVPVGRTLNAHANACARLLIGDHGLTRDAVAEAFPSSFMGLMLPEPPTGRLRRNSRSDVYFEAMTQSGAFDRVLDLLMPGHRFAQDPSAITDHDERSAFVCALTAFCLARGQYCAAGDEDGRIILPPRELIADWAVPLLVENAREAGGRGFSIAPDVT